MMGDLLVNVNVFIPRSLNQSEKEIVASMKDKAGFRPTEADRSALDRKYREMLR